MEEPEEGGSGLLAEVLGSDDVVALEDEGSMASVALTGEDGSVGGMEDEEVVQEAGMLSELSLADTDYGSGSGTRPAAAGGVHGGEGGAQGGAEEAAAGQTASDLIEINLQTAASSEAGEPSPPFSLGPMPQGPPTAAVPVPTAARSFPTAPAAASAAGPAAGKPGNPFLNQGPQGAMAAPLTPTPTQQQQQRGGGSTPSRASGEATAGVMIIANDDEFRAKANQVKSRVEEHYHILMQRMNERFKKDKSGLITPDDEVEHNLLVLKRIGSDFARLEATMLQYKANIGALAGAQRSMSQYLCQQGVRNQTAVGVVMRNLGEAQSSLATSMNKALVPTVDTLLGQLRTYTSRVLKDTEESVKKLQKLRVKYDSERTWLKNLEGQKEKKPDKYESVRAKLTKSEAEYNTMRKNVMTKILMVNDNRIQMLNKALGAYHASLTEHMVDASDILGSAVGSQKAVVGQDLSDKLVLD